MERRVCFRRQRRPYSTPGGCEVAKRECLTHGHPPDPNRPGWIKCDGLDRPPSSLSCFNHTKQPKHPNLHHHASPATAASQYRRTCVLKDLCCAATYLIYPASRCFPARAAITFRTPHSTAGRWTRPQRRGSQQKQKSFCPSLDQPGQVGAASPLFLPKWDFLFYPLPPLSLITSFAYNISLRPLQLARELVTSRNNCPAARLPPLHEIDPIHIAVKIPSPPVCSVNPHIRGPRQQQES